MTLRRVASRAVVAAAAAVFLAGCPLGSDTPLSDPGAAAPDPALVGTWRAVDPETGESNLIQILVFNSHEMVALAPESDPARTSAMRVFPTRIGSETFLNVQELGSSGHEWSFVNYRVDKDTLRMKVVDDELFKGRTFATSEELRTFVGGNLADPRLYAAADEKPSEMIWTRLPESSGSSGAKS